MRARVLVAAAFVLIAASAGAQQSVALQFGDGRVTLRARNAPVGTILAEWARLGSATIVNGDRITGPPVTLELVDVPERQALDVVLRSVAGYMLGPRRTGSVGASSFDRIMILPTSTAPRTPPAPAAAAPRPGVLRPPIVRPPVAAPEPVDEPVENEPADDDVNEATPAVASPTLPRVIPPAARVAQPPETDAPESEPSAAAAVPVTPSNPFGVPLGSSATPGVIAPVPRPQPQQQGPTNRVQ